MSQLYGIISHAALCSLLKTYNKTPFCDCALTPSTQQTKTTKKEKKHRRTRRKHAAQIAQNIMSQRLHDDLLAFMKFHHMFVHAVEKRVACEGLCGRVDCILQSHIDRKKMFIIDWKFTKCEQQLIHMDYVVQLNIYMYIMRRMAAYKNCTFTLYCFIFTEASRHVNIFRCQHLSDAFIQSLITKTICN